MSERNKILLLFGAALMFLCGCMSVDCVMTETFPAVEKVEKFDRASEIPYAYDVIGVCQTEGNYTEFSYDDMMKRIVDKAKANGADGVLMLGMRVVPDGRVVQTSPLRDSLDGSSTGNPWGEIGKDFGGGYGSIRSKSYGTSQTYDRIIRVQLLRFKRDTEGRFMPKPKNAPVHTGTEAIKTMKEIKEELKNAKAD